MTEIMPVPRNLSFTVLPAESLTLVFLFALRWRKRCSDKGYVPQCINYINPYGFNQSRSGRANNRALFIAMSNVRHVDALYMEP